LAVSIFEVLDLLACPRCAQTLSLAEGRRSVCCGTGHVFDLGRQGYLNLLGTRQPRNADTPAMIAARDRFLSAGHYAPIADRLAALVGSAAPSPTVLDAGCGTGYYLARLLEAAPQARGLGIDVSVAACRRASRAHPRLGAVVADVWQALPVRSSRCDVVVSVFAPRSAAEFARVLRSTGRLLVVHPEQDHLVELREPLGLLSIEAAKSDRLDDALAPLYELDHAEQVRFRSTWEAATLIDLIEMGPNAFHPGDVGIAERVLALRLPLEVTVSVRISAWHPRGVAIRGVD
jgi:23S rRNA (guanine745-N1)-methyltransferase